MDPRKGYDPFHRGAEYTGTVARVEFIFKVNMRLAMSLVDCYNAALLLFRRRTYKNVSSHP